MGGSNREETLLEFTMHIYILLGGGAGSTVTYIGILLLGGGAGSALTYIGMLLLGGGARPAVIL